MYMTVHTVTLCLPIALSKMLVHALRCIIQCLMKVMSIAYEQLVALMMSGQNILRFINVSIFHGAMSGMQ